MIISADEIKKRIKGYHPKKAEQFHRQSARLADKAFEKALKENKYQQVILMSGGSASGKTEFVSEYLTQPYNLTFDGTLSTPKGAEIKIRKILKSKREPIIYAVLPDDLSRAFVAFLHRDRQFSDEHFYRTHSDSRKTLLWIVENYPQIKIKIYESSYSAKQDMIFREIIFDNRKQQIGFLQKIQYKEENIIKLVNNNYEKKNIGQKKSK